MTNMTVTWCWHCGEGVVNFCRGHADPCPMQDHIDVNKAKILTSETSQGEGLNQDVQEGT